jgi:hypothetical protein
MSEQSTIETTKSKIAKLLAKAEGTTNDAERDTYLAKAESLMLRLGIERAELESAGKVEPEKIVEVTRRWTGNYSIVMVPFVHRLARAFGDITVLQTKNHNGMIRTTYIIGHQSDVAEFCRLIDSLALQVMSALKRWQREVKEQRRYYTDMEKYTGNRSFISGFGAEVARRIANERQRQQTTEATPGAALVLAAKQPKIDSWVEKTYGPLRSSRGGAQTSDWSASQSGARAGRNADLGHGRVNGGAGAIGS